MKVHFPKNKLDLEVAKYRLAYWELWHINFNAIGSKLESFRESEWRSLPIPLNPERVKELLAFFPFQFTDQQKIALFQILKDMEKPHVMQRLLEWDVGTGKTAVAFVAGVYSILESG
jgi:ATP-dependent DNA helicase RecG